MMNTRCQPALRLTLLILCTFAPAAAGQAPTLYKQCPALTAAPGKEAEAAQHLAALKDKDPQVRAQAVARLVKGCDSRAVGPLVSLLKDADPLVRVTAVEILGQLGDRATIDPLMELAEDPDWRVRLALSRSLCSFQVHAASYAALNRIANPGGMKIADENDMRVRCTAILVVNQLSDVSFSRKAVQFLYAFLQDERPALRRVAEQTMLELKQTRNGPHELMGILKQHNNPAFRE